MSQRHWDVIIVGGGILGLSHAYFARLRGLSTLLIERSTTPAGASVRNFGMIIPSGMPKGEWLQRAKAGAAFYKELAGQFQFSLKKCGTQYVAATPLEETVIREFADNALSLEQNCDFLDNKQTVETNSVLNSDFCRASLLFPNDLRIESRQFLAAFIDWLIKTKGLTYHPETLVTRVQRDGDLCEVTTSREERFSARHVIICSGAELRTLFPSMFAKSGLLLCKLQMMRSEPQSQCRLHHSIASGLSLRHYPSFRACTSWNALIKEPVDSELQEYGIHILMVQDEAGRIIIGDSHEYSESDVDDRLNTKVEELILNHAKKIAGLDHWNIEQRWHGVYSMHREQAVFMKEIPENIQMVTGIGGKGMTTGPGLAMEMIDNLQ